MKTNQPREKASGDPLKNAGKETVILFGETKIRVEGCRRILEYVPQKIRLQLSKKVLSVTGKNLFCTSFCGKHTTIEGSIVSLAFEEIPPT